MIDSPGTIHFFDDVDQIMIRLHEIYTYQLNYLKTQFHAYTTGQPIPKKVHGYYPFLEITTDRRGRVDTRHSYGFVEEPGTYQTTITRPDLYDDYYRHQLHLLLKNHGVPIGVGVSDQVMPIHFAFEEGLHVEAGLTPQLLADMPNYFDVPDLAALDDRIVNGTFIPQPGEPSPLALFTGPRVDYSLHRLRHYTATSPSGFQRFVLFTNYQFYVDEFVKLGLELMSKGSSSEVGYTEFIQPGNYKIFNQNLCDKPPEGQKLDRLPQMPAYHLVRPDHAGITMINIGVGPTNAKTITDHVAVLRPHAWIMLGHCAGLRGSQKLGDYVLAHGYVREDHALDHDLPLGVPLPPLSEIQLALEEAVTKVTKMTDYELKKIMRTGTIVTVDNRNWELNGHFDLVRGFNQTRAIALDMESATIAANGFRFRVPYGTLLCVSDKPLHGEIKLAGMADHFYRAQVNQHLKIGVAAMEILGQKDLNTLHSRKLRCFADAAFQ